MAELIAIKREGGSVTRYGKGRALTQAELFGLACDILVPAAWPNSIHAGNAPTIRARLILEGANLPTTPEAEAMLHRRGVLVIPDFIANAGGVICAAVEYRGGSEVGAMERIAETIGRNTRDVLARSRAGGIEPRRAAVELARERVRTAMALRAAR